ncbi:MAG: hypothetical protein AAB847_00200 [Patescibacteria group bacterium]
MAKGLFSAGAALICSIFPELQRVMKALGATDEDLNVFNEDDGKMVIAEMAVAAVKAIKIIRLVKKQVAEWTAFYVDLLGEPVDFTNLWIPPKPEGLDRLIIVKQGMTPSKLFGFCLAKFLAWKYWDDLDCITSDRKADHDYAIWVRDRVEADEELQNRSAENLRESGVVGITLEERFLYELKYFKETGKHLDIVNVTLCAGSHGPGGRMVRVRWRGDGLGASWSYPQDAYPCLRARAVVS